MVVGIKVLVKDLIMQELSPGDLQTNNVNLDAPSFYVNREISWLEFNRRVLEEAQDETTPIMEKLKFASIFSSNLDEFFMVRVGSLSRALGEDVDEPDASGRTLRQELSEISELVRQLVTEQYKCITGEILPKLKEQGIVIHRIGELDEKESNRLDKYFQSQIFPILTPLAIDAGHPFPFLSNLRIILMVVFKELNNSAAQQPYAFVEVPSVLPRLVPVNVEMPGYHYIFLEDLVRKHIQGLFPGMEIKSVTAIRVTRNHDYDLQESEVMDLLKSVEYEIKEQSHKIAVRLEIEPDASRKILEMLEKHLDIDEKFVYPINGPMNICDLMPLHDLPVSALHEKTRRSIRESPKGLPRMLIFSRLFVKAICFYITPMIRSLS